MNSVIKFPYLGFEVNPGKSIEIFGISIAYYGIIIAIAAIVGALVAFFIAVISFLSSRLKSEKKKAADNAAMEKDTKEM